MKVRRIPWWALPAFSVGLGLACLVAFWVGGQPGSGLISLAIMAGLGLFLALGGRSEAIRGLRGDGRDEYWQNLDLGATLVAGVALVVAVIVMAMWEWAHGRDGRPYTLLGALAGIIYLVALVVLRLRR